MNALTMLKAVKADAKRNGLRVKKFGDFYAIQRDIFQFNGFEAKHTLKDMYLNGVASRAIN